MKKKQKSLLELIKQDPKVLAKSCKEIQVTTLEEELIELFSNKDVQKQIKDKCVISVKSGLDMNDNLKIEITMSNDKLVEKMKAKSVELFDKLIKDLAKALSKKGDN